LAAGVVIHGIGMCNEYPQVVPAHFFDVTGYDGFLEPGMTVCVESYIGKRGGSNGVKLEQLILITADGPRVMTTFPFEEQLLT
jgi:Xaa-Pro aminopeptidase